MLENGVERVKGGVEGTVAERVDRGLVAGRLNIQHRRRQLCRGDVQVAERLVSWDAERRRPTGPTVGEELDPRNAEEPTRILDRRKVQVPSIGIAAAAAVVVLGVEAGAHT